MNALATLIYLVGQVLFWMLVIWSVLGWLITFNVVNARNPLITSVMHSFAALFEPMLRPIRRFLPRTSIDFSPIVLAIIIIVLQVFLIDSVIPFLRSSF